MGKVIAILQDKGGVGKTTLAVNLSRALQTGGEVCLIDTDEKGVSRAWASISPPSLSPTLFQVFAVAQAQAGASILKMAASYDYVVVDGAANMPLKLAAGIIKASDLVLIPARPSGADLFGIEEIVDGVIARHDLAGKPAGRFVVTQFDPRTIVARQIDEELESFGLPTLSGRMSNLVVYMEAISAGVTVFESKHRGAKAAQAEVLLIKENVLELLA